MNINEILANLDFTQVWAFITSSAFLTTLGFIYNFTKKNAKARSENEVNEIETRGVIKAKDAQIEALIAQIAKMQNVVQASTEYSRAVAQVLVNDPDIKANLEKVYNDSRAVLSYTYERGKELIDTLQTTAKDLIQKVEVQKEQLEAVANDGIIASIIKKAGV